MATKYSLTVQHHGTDFGDFCLYQTNDDQSEDIRSLAWFTKSAHPETTLTFEWNIDYSFTWSEEGVLVPGVVFKASQIIPADPMDVSKNSIAFSRDKGAFLFHKTNMETSQGRLGICCDSNIPSNTASIGVGMSGKSAYACVASPTLRYTFKPHPRYWVAFGRFEEGEVMDLNRMTEKFEIVFQANHTNMSLELTPNNTFHINS